MGHNDWLDDNSTEEFIKGFMDAMFTAKGVDPATVPERIQKEKEGIFIPDKAAVSKVRTIYHHMKVAFSGTDARADVITNDGTLFHNCLIKVRCNGFAMNEAQAAEFFEACRIAHSVDILPDDPECEPAEDGYSMTVMLYADKDYEPAELVDPETDVEAICDDIDDAEIESDLKEYAIFNPDMSEIEMQVVELDFLTSKSPLMKALRIAKSFDCRVDDVYMIMNIKF